MQGVMMVVRCTDCLTQNRVFITSKRDGEPVCGQCKKDLFVKFAVMHGYVYVLSNNAMPGLLKIGQTKNDIRIRVAQLLRLP